MNPKANDVQNEKKEGAKEPVSGEGSYEATRRYNEGLEKSVQRGDADELAEEAKKALDGPEGEELRKAEEQGKQGAIKNAPK